MSSDLAIRFEDVGKEYRVGAASTGGRYSYQSLGERLAGALRNPLRAAAGALRRPDTDSFWALKGVSFDVPRGEVVGVIGRNGAGKSTLLKILSQITRPSEGQIEVHGRVGSLLEVGTGFHPELTGRENIFLNGAILGMTQREVRAKFDEIVAFSEVERFLDTPVKQYSSGMYTRLAFAVAAHLDPEILVVDEVLAVGDAAFQKKCLGKMQDVASGGRTVLFVSHNMAAVKQLCTKGVVLEKGSVVLSSSAADAIEWYRTSNESPDNGDGFFRLESRDASVSILGVRITDGDGRAACKTGDAAKISIQCDLRERLIDPGFVVSIATLEGIELLRLSNQPLSGVACPHNQGLVDIELRIAMLALTAGIYRLSVGVAMPNIGFQIPLTEAFTFEVHDSNYYQSGSRLDQSKGYLVADHQWAFHQPVEASVANG